MTTAVAKIEKTGLVKYDAMQHAIAVAVAVDEVKDIRDKAMALEKYAAQARNFEAERRCAQLRIQAELKGGLLLKSMEKSKGTRVNGKDKGGKSRLVHDERADVRTIEQLGLSATQATRWQQLASNPRAVERYLRNEEDVPTTAGALAAVAPREPIKAAALPFSDEALWFTARLRDLVKANINPARIAKGCDDDLKADNRKSIDILVPLLEKVRKLL